MTFVAPRTLPTLPRRSQLNVDRIELPDTTAAWNPMVGEWEADDKGAKETARAMSAMVAAINGEYLKNIPALW